LVLFNEKKVRSTPKMLVKSKEKLAKRVASVRASAAATEISTCAPLHADKAAKRQKVSNLDSMPTQQKHRTRGGHADKAAKRQKVQIRLTLDKHKKKIRISGFFTK